MAMNVFPPLEDADHTGLLAIGGQLNSATLLEAYSKGIFPWPFDERLLAWFSPPSRAVLYLNKYHPTKRLLRRVKQHDYEVKVDTCFSEVIERCAKSPNRKGQSGTWITKDMIKAYCRLHREGFAHSIECFQDGTLTGGIYGVAIGKMFAGESMFYTEPNASQIAFYHLVELLKEQDVKLIDCQVLTSHTAKLGAEEISRDAFLKFLRKAILQPPINFKAGSPKD